MWFWCIIPWVLDAALHIVHRVVTGRGSRPGWRRTLCTVQQWSQRHRSVRANRHGVTLAGSNIPKPYQSQRSVHQSVQVSQYSGITIQHYGHTGSFSALLTPVYAAGTWQQLYPLSTTYNSHSGVRWSWCVCAHGDRTHCSLVGCSWLRCLAAADYVRCVLPQPGWPLCSEQDAFYESGLNSKCVARQCVGEYVKGGMAVCWAELFGAVMWRYTVRCVAVPYGMCVGCVQCIVGRWWSFAGLCS